MSYYPDVTPGTPISFSAKRETEINRLLNQADNFKTGVIAGKTAPVVRVQVWNSTQTAFAAGQAVQIDVSGSLCGNAFPAVNFASVDAPFGVCANGIAPNAIGDLIFSGPSTVTISGSSGSYAKPVSGGTFSRGNEGCKILNLSGGTNAVVMLGDYKHDSGGGGGGGFPDFINGSTVSAEITYGPFSYPVWLIGNVDNNSSDASGDCECTLSFGNAGSHIPPLHLMNIVGLKSPGTYVDYVPLITNPVCLPIPAGISFYVGHTSAHLDLYFYPCI